MKKVILLGGAMGSGNTTLYNALLDTGEYQGIDLAEIKCKGDEVKFREKLMPFIDGENKLLVVDNVSTYFAVMSDIIFAPNWCKFLRLFSDERYNIELIIDPQSKLLELEDSNKK